MTSFVLLFMLALPYIRACFLKSFVITLKNFRLLGHIRPKVCPKQQKKYKTGSLEVALLVLLLTLNKFDINKLHILTRNCSDFYQSKRHLLGEQYDLKKTWWCVYIVRCLFLLSLSLMIISQKYYYPSIMSRILCSLFPIISQISYFHFKQCQVYVLVKFSLTC